MEFVIKHIDLVVYDWKELDIEQTEMVELMVLGSNVHRKLCWLTKH